jgi:segregation and condensation protein B
MTPKNSEAVTEVEQDEALDETASIESLSREETRQALYALLFVSDRPVSADRLAEVLGDADRHVVETLLEELKAEIDEADVPFALREIAGGYQFTTRPEHAIWIKRFLQIKKRNRLSKAVLETLSIIAYKQPATRAQVEAVRGVSVSHAFEVLQEKHLIKVSGVAEVPGRPKLFRTTEEFLVHFGLKNLDDLPSIEELQEAE